jgi:large subunit ribosomal protein L15
VSQELLSPASGSKKDRKRVGRGNGSGHGTYSGRGCKGQKARTGNNKVRPGFEGGQLPLIKRLPRKRGFTNIFRVEYEVVNLSSLCIFEAGSEITADALVEAKIIKNTKKPLKILSRGDLKQSLTVKADKFSAAAKAKIEAAGGTVIEVTNG